MKYSIVIPVVPKHDKYLHHVIESLSTEGYLVREIIVARSELAPHKVNQYKKFLVNISKSFNLEEKIILSHDSKNCLAHANLNRGWKMAQSEYVTFLGADDIYAPYRLRVIDEVLRLKPDSNAILHSHYLEDQSNNYLESSKNNFKPLSELGLLSKVVEERLVDTDDIFNKTFPTGKRDHLSECFGNTSIKVPRNEYELSGVTQGNVVVRTELREKLLFKPLQYGEDGVLCLDILENFGKVYFIALELSVYRKFLSVNRISSRSSILKHKILKFTPEYILKIFYD
jgi:hypothetical protein